MGVCMSVCINMCHLSVCLDLFMSMWSPRCLVKPLELLQLAIVTIFLLLFFASFVYIKRVLWCVVVPGMGGVLLCRVVYYGVLWCGMVWWRTWGFVLCCVVLWFGFFVLFCFILLCCVVLCYAMLSYSVLCLSCVVLLCGVVCCAVA